MAGTKVGGQKTAATNKRKYGPDYYAELGALGGKKSSGPFRYNRELASRAGRLGGLASRRGKSKKVDEATV
jgi:general stress protein YciG